LDETEQSVLRAYEADKAIYEVVYEMRNRPDWIGIPLRAVAELAAENQDPGELASPTKERGELASPTREQE
jgi:maltokinase